MAQPGEFMRTRNPPGMFRTALLCTVLIVAATAAAADRFYVGPDGGSWSDPDNWSATSGGAGGAGVPVGGDWVYVDNATAANIATTLDVSYSAPGLLKLYLDGTNGFINTVFQTDPAAFNMVVETEEIIGNFGAGRYVQSTGQHAPGALTLGWESTGRGTYELSGGGLSPSQVLVGHQGNGTFIQSGGIHKPAIGLFLANSTGSSGRYDLSGGTLDLSATSLFVGASGTGVFNQTDGVLTVSSFGTHVGHQPGSAGTFNHSGGSYTTGGLSLGSNPASGTLSLPRGIYNLDGAVLTVAGGLNVGGYGEGTFNHNGGTVTLTTGVGVAIGAGTFSIGHYLFNDGTFAHPGMTVGDQGLGEFTQNAGTHLVSGNVIVALYDSSIGTFNHSGGVTTIGGGLATGAGVGVINISGGTVESSGGVGLGTNVISAGVINLSGGYLETNYIRNEGTFNHSGGTFSGTLVGNGVYNFIPPPGFGPEGAGVATLSAASMTINSVGSVNWASGDIVIGAGSTIRNDGIFRLPVGGTMDSLGLGAGSVNNRGIVIKPTVVGSVGTTTFGAVPNRLSAGGDLTFVNDNGTLQIDSGTLLINADFRTTAASTTTVRGAGTLVLAGSQDWAAGSKLHVLDGSHTVLSANLGASNRPDVQVGSTGTIYASMVQRIATLTLDTGGTMDLKDNDLMAGGTSTVSQVAGYIAAARNGGAWDQPGLTSSAADSHVSGATTLGVLSGSDYIDVNSTLFNGFTVTAPDVLVKYTWYGDTDFNGLIDGDDYARIDNGFNFGLGGWLNGDSDLNGFIDGDDYALIDLAFNVQSGTLRRAVDFISGDDRSLDGMNTPGLVRVREHWESFGVEYGQSFLAAVPEPSLGVVAWLLTAWALARRRCLLATAKHLCVAAMAVSLAATTAHADDRYYVGPDGGIWNDPANWSLTSGGGGGASVPVAGDRVFLDNATTSNISTTLDLSYATPGPLHLFLDGLNGFTNTLLQTSAAVNMAATQQFIGDVGSGRYIHNAGLNSATGGFVVGNMPTGNGTYELGGGTLLVAEEVIGQLGSATFTQSGGFHTATLGMYVAADLGSFGRFSLGGGTLAITGSQLVGEKGAGLFTQSGGVQSVGLNTAVGNQSGGIGTYNHSAGSNTIGGYLAVGASAATGSLSASKGTYNLSGSAVLIVGSNIDTIGDIGVGDFGEGTFNQSGGSAAVDGGVLVGQSAGSNGVYNFADGTLNVGAGMIIGSSAGSRGEFVKSGGTMTVAANGVIARFAGSVGTFTHDGGVSTFGGNLMTYQGTGVININGGTVITNGNVDNGSYTITAGVINLSGGHLFTNYINNEGIFNHSGGTFSGTLVGNGVYNFIPPPGFGPEGAGVATLSAASMTINSVGSVNWASGDIVIGGDSTVRNDGIFRLPVGGTIDSLGLGAGSVNNRGMVIKPTVVGSVGTTTFGAVPNRLSAGGDLTFVNDNGTLQIDSGTLLINADFRTTASSTTTVRGAGTLVLAGSQDWAGGSKLHVLDGSHTVLNGNLGASNRPDVQVGSTGTIHANTVQRIATLTLDTGGTMDMKDNDLMAGGTSTVSQVAAYIVAARNGGEWDQPGLTSSAADSHVSGATTLGVLSGSDYIDVNSTLFNGFAVSASDVLVKYTWYGDTDFNGFIDGDDYARIDNGFNFGLGGWLNGDSDLNGFIDGDDYALIDLAFNVQSGTLRRAVDFISGDDRSLDGMNAPGLLRVRELWESFGASYGQSFLAAVPEPVAGALLGLTVLLGNRRRKPLFS
jgi:hypothetical protein